MSWAHTFHDSYKQRKRVSEAEGTARAKSLWQEGAQKRMKASVAGVQKMGTVAEEPRGARPHTALWVPCRFTS